MDRKYPALLLRWPTPPSEDDRDLLLAALDDFGVNAIDDVDGVARYFFSSVDGRDRAAAAMADIDPTAMCEPALISDESWAERSQASITAVRVGQLVVAPPWAIPEDGSSTIVIQPSMGFGTAHHESTRLCLGLLQTLPTVGPRVLDVGTGSGVLALAAHRLGAREVIAVDYDPDALVNAAENLALNGVANAIGIELFDLAAPERFATQTFDLVFANLTGGVLIRFAGTLASLTTHGGRLITSGVTAEEDTGVTAALTAAGFRLEQRDTEREWVGAIWSR